MSLPDADSLAALRAWYQGLSTREAVSRYLGQNKAEVESSRGILGRVRRRLAAYARQWHREELAALFSHPESQRHKHARAVAKAMRLASDVPTST